VNFVAGVTTPNLATVAVGDRGDLCVYVSVAAHVVVDLSGWYGAGGDRLASVVPARAADTRSSGRKLGAGKVLVVDPSAATGAARSDVHAVALNVTATEEEDTGFLTVYPCDATPPLASNVNYAAGRNVADAAIVGVSADGTVCVFSSASTHVVVDVTGWFGPSAPASFTARSPQRLVDTRASSAPVAANSVLTVPLPDAGARAAALNVTVTGPAAAGYITAYPCGATRPMTSTLNFSAGDIVANAAVVTTGATGAVCIFASATTHVVVDLAGTFTGGALGTGSTVVDWGYTQLRAPYAAINPYRFGDSRYGARWACDDGSNPCTRVDMHGTSHTYPAGIFVYDCSGFITAAWLRGGVDLVKAAAAVTDAMFDRLPHVDPRTARPGDIVLFKYAGAGTASRTDHGGLLVTPTSMIHAGNDGIEVSGIDWREVVAVVRPTG
jgi:cell wall-associated NlpC family hydrolase